MGPAEREDSFVQNQAQQRLHSWIRVTHNISLTQPETY
jgi:hypothetical protein